MEIEKKVYLLAVQLLSFEFFLAPEVKLLFLPRDHMTLVENVIFYIVRALKILGVIFKKIFI